MEASNLGFIDSIIGAVSQATTNIANAFARGAEAGETTKQQVAASQAEIERAKAAARAAEAQAQAAMAAAAAQAQTAMSTSEGRMATVKAVAPWIGAAVLGVGLLFMLGRRR
jgi:biopolymer transport protein ExbB/TolQ